tara:strand:- start:18 stop:302 length:285 start_codon:yes stop_codon:yes gene_type:complete
MVGFLDNVESEEQEEYISAKTFIKCTECNDIFVSREINEENPIGICECENIIVGIHKLEHSKYTHFVVVEWDTSPPEIFEEEKKNDRSMELMEA